MAEGGPATAIVAPLPIEITALTSRGRPGLGGEQHIFRFPNGYGASIVRGYGTYGYEQGLYELAVIRFVGDDPDDFGLCYSTPITDDVLGYLSIEDVAVLLLRVAKLDG